MCSVRTNALWLLTIVLSFQPSFWGDESNRYLGNISVKAKRTNLFDIDVEVKLSNVIWNQCFKLKSNDNIHFYYVDKPNIKNKNRLTFLFYFFLPKLFLLFLIRTRCFERNRCIGGYQQYSFSLDFIFQFRKYFFLFQKISYLCSMSTYTVFVAISLVRISLYYVLNTRVCIFPIIFVVYNTFKVYLATLQVLQFKWKY